VIFEHQTSQDILEKWTNLSAGNFMIAIVVRSICIAFVQFSLHIIYFQQSLLIPEYGQLPNKPFLQHISDIHLLKLFLRICPSIELIQLLTSYSSFFLFTKILCRIAGTLNAWSRSSSLSTLTCIMLPDISLFLLYDSPHLLKTMVSFPMF
jgi:hypothetical protein